MTYTYIVNLVFMVIWTIVGLMLAQYALFTVLGILKKKKFPVTDKKLKYGILIAARNEQRVIGGLLDSIRQSDYPADKLKVFVIAHNCTDDTAKIAREKGATVYEYDNPRERTVGFAYRHLIKKIDDDFGCGSFDGFFIINADNILTKDYLARMNDAFVATDKKCVITSYRNSKNFGANYMSCLYGIFFLACCRYESRGRTVCGCSTRVSGTGYLFNSDIVSDGWNYVTLTEDWEFSADRIAEGEKILYCDDAQFYDEQPTTMKIMLRQRFRWARGHMIVFFTRFRKLLGSLFRPKKKGGKDNKYSVYDISVTILPLGVISVALTLIQAVLLAFAPLCGADPAAVWIQFGWMALFAFCLSYSIMLIMGKFLVILERKRIPKVKPHTMIAALALWPFFMFLNIFLDLFALFRKHVEWKVIPHGDRAADTQQAALPDMADCAEK